MLTLRQNAWVVPAFLPKGYHVVSIAYRCAPQVGIDDILDDCASALAWCQQHLPEIVGSVDVESYVVAGDSAGGSLATLCGHLLRPRPKAVIDIYGVVDFLDPYYSHGYPNPEYIRDWPEGYLEKAANDRDPSKAVTTIALRRDLPPNQTTEELQIRWGTKYTPSDKDYEVNDMYRYMGSKASLMSTLFRKEKYTDAEYDAVRKDHSPLFILQTEAGKEYPPTFILHGTSDSAVLIAQSHAFVEVLKKNGIDVGYVYTDGAEHCFDDYIEVRFTIFFSCAPLMAGA